MILSDYEKALDRMELTDREFDLTSAMPPPVAYGYVCAARKANHNRKLSFGDWSEYGKGLFGL